MRGTMTIQADPGRQRLVVEAGGFFDRDTTREFMLAYQAAEQEITRLGPFDLLLDATRYQPQARDVMEDIASFTATSAFAGRRVAAVAPSMIVQLQMKRILVGTNSAVFTDRQAAEEWLDAGLAEADRALSISPGR